jgi:DNA repair exonuclease SbcCD ATPase subunit
MSRIRYLDISELNDRLSELEGLRDELASFQEELEGAETEKERAEIQAELDRANDAFGIDEQNELKNLENLRDEIGERHGEINDEGGPFVHANDFEEYAQELAEDIGAIDRNASWPNSCIDWERAARELQMDYTSVDWDGDTYYYRP